MKLFSSTLLALSLSADAFVIQGSQPAPSPFTTTTSLNDVGLQWGFDENGCRNEYFLEHWSERNNDVPQSNWAYDPWSGVSQTLFVPRHKEMISEVQQAFTSMAILGATAPQMKTEAVAAQQQQIAPLPPAQPAQPMPDLQVAAPPRDQYAVQYAAQQMMN